MTAIGTGDRLIVFGGVLHAFDARAMALWQDRELAMAALAAGATARGNRWRR